MEPLRSRLQLRSSLYDDPDGILDRAMLQVQQASDASDAGVSVTLLRNVVRMLQSASTGSEALAAVSSPVDAWAADGGSASGDGTAFAAKVRCACRTTVAPPIVAGTASSANTCCPSTHGRSNSRSLALTISHPFFHFHFCVMDSTLRVLVSCRPTPLFGPQTPGESGGLDGKRLHNLWAEVASLAFRRREGGILRQAAQVLACVSWDVTRNREMVLQQAESELLFAEGLARDVAAAAVAAPHGDEEAAGEQDAGDDDEADERKKVLCC